MENRKLTILSTAHLHPLEAQQLEKVATVANQFVALFSTVREMRNHYRESHFPCLAELLVKVKEKTDADYVLFDPDVSVTNLFKSYDW